MRDHRIFILTGKCSSNEVTLSDTYIMLPSVMIAKKNHQEPEIKHNGQLNEKKKVFHRTDIKI